MRHRIVCCLLLFIGAFLAARPAWAQLGAPATGSLVKIGQTLDVIDDQGRETHGKVSAFTQATIDLVNKNGAVTQIPVEHITQIAGEKDGLGNGARLGFAVGGGLGLLGAWAASHDCTLYSACPKGAGFIVSSVVMLGGMGAAIGVGLDALFHHDNLLYRRASAPHATLSPLIGRQQGAAVTMRW
jgi:hypothetical protein